MKLRPRLTPPAAPSRWALATCATALLGACAHVSPGSPDDVANGPPQGLQAPAQWSAPAAVSTAAATSLSRWWQRFNDPELSALVREALQANTGVQSAQAALRQARALRDVQVANAGPTLGVSASAQRSRNGNNDASSRFQAGLDAGWEIDVFGRTGASVKASEADAQAAETSLADVQVSLAAEVAAAYIGLRGAQARLAIARRSLALQAETQQITEWRQQAGLASALEVAQATTATEQTRAQVPALQTSVAQSLHAIAVLTGQAPGRLDGRLDAAPVAEGIIPQAPDDLALAFPADTLRQRPDVRTAELRVKAAMARRDAADAARYPSFRLGGSLGLSALTLGALTDGASVLRSLLTSVSMPLWDGGATQAQVRAQTAALEQAHLAHRTTVLGALEDVENALVALQGNRERLNHQQNAARAAEQAEALARQRYRSGLIDFRAVLDTQRSLLSAQDSLASTQVALGQDHVRLYKALGGGWTPNAPSTTAR